MNTTHEASQAADKVTATPSLEAPLPVSLAHHSQLSLTNVQNSEHAVHPFHGDSTLVKVVGDPSKLPSYSEIVKTTESLTTNALKESLSLCTISESHPQKLPQIASSSSEEILIDGATIDTFLCPPSRSSREFVEKSTVFHGKFRKPHVSIVFGLVHPQSRVYVTINWSGFYLAPTAEWLDCFRVYIINLSTSKNSKIKNQLKFPLYSGSSAIVKTFHWTQKLRVSSRTIYSIPLRKSLSLEEYSLVIEKCRSRKFFTWFVATFDATSKKACSSSSVVPCGFFRDWVAEPVTRVSYEVSHLVFQSLARATYSLTMRIVQLPPVREVAVRIGYDLGAVAAQSVSILVNAIYQCFQLVRQLSSLSFAGVILQFNAFFQCCVQLKTDPVLGAIFAPLFQNLTDFDMFSAVNEWKDYFFAGTGHLLAALQGGENLQEVAPTAGRDTISSVVRKFTRSDVSTLVKRFVAFAASLGFLAGLKQGDLLGLSLPGLAMFAQALSIQKMEFVDINTFFDFVDDTRQRLSRVIASVMKGNFASLCGTSYYTELNALMVWIRANVGVVENFSGTLNDSSFQSDVTRRLPDIVIYSGEFGHMIDVLEGNNEEHAPYQWIPGIQFVISTLKEKLKAAIDCKAFDHVSTVHLRAALVELQAMDDTTPRRMDKLRAEGFVIGLTGVPGTGKTNHGPMFVNLIYSIIVEIGRKYGYPMIRPDMDGSLPPQTRDLGSPAVEANFFTDEVQKLCLSLSDPHCHNDDWRAPTKESLVRLIQAVMDTHTWKVDGASMAAKDFNFILSLLLVVSTNDEDCGVKTIAKDPLACVRRMVFVEVLANPRYKKGHGQIDASNRYVKDNYELPSSPEVMNLYNLYTFIPVQIGGKYQAGDKVCRKPISHTLDGKLINCENMSHVDMLRVMRDLATTHFEKSFSRWQLMRQVNTMTSSVVMCPCADSNHASFCPKCTSLQNICSNSGYLSVYCDCCQDIKALKKIRSDHASQRSRRQLRMPLVTNDVIIRMSSILEGDFPQHRGREFVTLLRNPWFNPFIKYWMGMISFNTPEGVMRLTRERLVKIQPLLLEVVSQKAIVNHICSTLIIDKVELNKAWQRHFSRDVADTLKDLLDYLLWVPPLMEGELPKSSHIIPQMWTYMNGESQACYRVDGSSFKSQRPEVHLSLLRVFCLHWLVFRDYSGSIEDLWKEFILLSPESEAMISMIRFSSEWSAASPGMHFVRQFFDEFDAQTWCSDPFVALAPTRPVFPKVSFQMHKRILSDSRMDWSLRPISALEQARIDLADAAGLPRPMRYDELLDDDFELSASAGGWNFYRGIRDDPGSFSFSHIYEECEKLRVKTIDWLFSSDYRKQMAVVAVVTGGCGVGYAASRFWNWSTDRSYLKTVVAPTSDAPWNNMARNNDWWARASSNVINQPYFHSQDGESMLTPSCAGLLPKVAFNRYCQYREGTPCNVFRVCVVENKGINFFGYQFTPQIFGGMHGFFIDEDHFITAGHLFGPYRDRDTAYFKNDIGLDASIECEFIQYGTFHTEAERVFKCKLLLRQITFVPHKDIAVIQLSTQSFGQVTKVQCLATKDLDIEFIQPCLSTNGDGEPVNATMSSIAQNKAADWKLDFTNKGTMVFPNEGPWKDNMGGTVWRNSVIVNQKSLCDYGKCGLPLFGFTGDNTNRPKWTFMYGIVIAMRLDGTKPTTQWIYQSFTQKDLTGAIARLCMPGNGLRANDNHYAHTVATSKMRILPWDCFQKGVSSENVAWNSRTNWKWTPSGDENPRRFDKYLDGSSAMFDFSKLKGKMSHEEYPWGLFQRPACLPIEFTQVRALTNEHFPDKVIKQGHRPKCNKVFDTERIGFMKMALTSDEYGKPELFDTAGFVPPSYSDKAAEVSRVNFSVQMNPEAFDVAAKDFDDYIFSKVEHSINKGWVKNLKSMQSPLSIEECYVGRAIDSEDGLVEMVPGLGALDFSTSLGSLPFGGPKKNVMENVIEEDRHSLKWIDDDVRVYIEQTNSEIESGICPRWQWVSLFEKDEVYAVKPDADYSRKLDHFAPDMSTDNRRKMAKSWFNDDMDVLSAEDSFEPLKAYLKRLHGASGEKIKLRLINLLPAGINTAYKRWFGPFCALVVSNPIYFDTVCGLNIVGPEAERVMYHVVAGTWNPKLKCYMVFDADVHSWDKLMPKCAIVMVLKTMARCTMTLLWKAWMKQEDHSEKARNAFAVLAAWAARTMIYVFGILFQNDGTVHSGWWLTLHVNNMINMIFHRYAFVSWAMELRIPYNEILPMENFLNLAVLGDDSWTGISNKLIPICEKYGVECYSMFDYARIMGRCGLHVTLANKMVKQVAYQKPADWVLLKRKFRYVDAWGDYAPGAKILVARLELTSIVRPLMVMDRNLAIPTFDYYTGTVDQVLKEMVLYSQERFQLSHDLMRTFDKPGWNAYRTDGGDESTFRLREWEHWLKDYHSNQQWLMNPWLNGEHPGMDRVENLRQMYKEDFKRLEILLADDDRVPHTGRALRAV